MWVDPRVRSNVVSASIRSTCLYIFTAAARCTCPGWAGLGRRNRSALDECVSRKKAVSGESCGCGCKRDHVEVCPPTNSLVSDPLEPGDGSFLRSSYSCLWLEDRNERLAQHTGRRLSEESLRSSWLRLRFEDSKERPPRQRQLRPAQETDSGFLPQMVARTLGALSQAEVR